MGGRRTTIRHTTTRLSLWLLIGAAATVLNAWFCAAFLPIGRTAMLYTFHSPYPTEAAITGAWIRSSWPFGEDQLQAVYAIERRMRAERGNIGAVEDLDFGMTWRSLRRPELRGDGYWFHEGMWGDIEYPGPAFSATRICTGWPCLSMGGSHWWIDDSGLGPVQGPIYVSAVEIKPWHLSPASATATAWFSRILPLQPLWTDFSSSIPSSTQHRSGYSYAAHSHYDAGAVPGAACASAAPTPSASANIAPSAAPSSANTSP